MFISFISAGNHSGYPFTVTGWEQERVTLVLKGWSCSVTHLKWRMGERVGWKRAAAPLSSEPPKRSVGDRSATSWHSIRGLHLGCPLAGPAQMPAMQEMDSTAALHDRLATLHHPMASVALGHALRPMGTAGRAVSTVPTGSLHDRETRRAKALAGMKGLAAGSMPLGVREEGKKQIQNQVKFWKNPRQTIPVVGTALSETQMCYLFIPATVLCCFINNRLVLERDRMGADAVITLLLLWGLP